MAKKKSNIRILYHYIFKYKRLFLTGIFITLFLAVINVFPPLLGQLALALTGGQEIAAFEKIPLVSELIHKGIDQKELAYEVIVKKKITRQFVFILITAGIYILLKITLDYFRSFIMTFLAHKTVVSIQAEMIDRLTHTYTSFFKKQKAGDIISKIQNDTRWLENYIYSTIPSLLYDPLLLLLTITILFMLSWKLTLVGVVLAPILAFIIIRIGKAIGSLIHTLQDKMGDYTSVMQQIIYGIEAIKIFGMEKHEHRRFIKKTDEYLKTDKKLLLVAAASRPSVEFFTMFSAITIVAYGGYLVFVGEIPFDYLWGFILYLLNAAQPINSISNIYINTQKARAAAERVFKIMDLPPEAKESEEVISPGTLKGAITFKNTSFKYSEEDEFSLGPIDFKIREGEAIAFVGMSGGGKTTLVNMIPKLITPTSGTIEIDGMDIRKLSTKTVRQNIGMVSQENILFYGSIKDNIRFGKTDASDDEVIEAAKIAHAHEFISGFTDGYNTQIGERGLLISGGQKQRIALARAVIRRPKILILDEATSALDTESEMYIQEALKDIIHKQTTLVIAHRLSTIKNANKIFVVEEGKIIESGTHDELMKHDGKYQYLYSLQFR
ncbi:ABC transporter ATP-binding protein [Spirochaetota bacterium]